MGAVHILVYVVAVPQVLAHKAEKDSSVEKRCVQVANMRIWLRPNLLEFVFFKHTTIQARTYTNRDIFEIFESRVIIYPATGESPSRTPKKESLGERALCVFFDRHD